MIDPAVKMESTTKAKMAKFKKCNEWLETHSSQRRYMFQLRKCKNARVTVQHRLEGIEMLEQNNITNSVLLDLIQLYAERCSDVWEIMNLKKDDITDQNLNALAEKLPEAEPCDTCSLPRLPLIVFMKLHWVPDPPPRGDDNSKFLHFEDFTEKKQKKYFDQRMLKISTRIINPYWWRKKQGKLFRAKIAWNRGEFMETRSYGKSRKMWHRDTETIFYRCGVPLFAEDHSLSGKVVTRCMLKCNDPVELLYFSTKKFPSCWWCCGRNVLRIIRSPETISEYLSVM